MHPIIRSFSRLTVLTWALGSFVLAASAQPTPLKTLPGGGPAASPASPATMGPPTPMLSPVMAGVLSKEEYAKYTAFQQHLNDDPAIKELNSKISSHLKELQQLQAEAYAVREKLIATNPEIKAIRDKIMSAGHAHAGVGPVPMPVPAKSN